MSKIVLHPEGRFGDRRGVAVGFIALVAVALIGMAALSVDLGVLLAARTEAQRAADAAALSGALSLLEAPGDVNRARDMAIEYGGLNSVHGSGTTVLTGDVDVITAQDRVRVRIIRSSSRGSALINIFAKILGYDTSNVSAQAAAHAGDAAGVNCPLPLVLVDRWWDVSSTPDSLADQDDEWTLGSDIYNPGPVPSLPGSATDPTGYGRDDRGRILRIYPAGPHGAPLPGWAYLLDLASGGNGVHDWIVGCPGGSDQVFQYGEPITIKNGMTTGPVRDGFNDLIAQDPSAVWISTGVNIPPGGCVTRPGVVDADGNATCVSSPRVKPMFLIHPTDAPTSPGNTDVALRNFVGVFVICVGVLQPSHDSCSGNINSAGGGVWIRLIDYRGVNVLPPNTNTSSLVRVLQLVE
jgi:Flp pilus assembly protein TadG